MEMPSQNEQLIAEQYVLERPLARPDTDAKKAVVYASAYLLVSFLIALLSFSLFVRLGYFSLPRFPLSGFFLTHPILFKLCYYLLIYCLIGICCLRSALIGVIRLYQHYASEEIRRRCLFKPTCSEYAILAIQKYGVFRGLWKAYVRLFRRCRGNIYQIDYP